MKIAVVIVTFNRLETLKGTLSAYAGQTLMPDLLIVVDNHSTDGTAEYLARWKSEQGPFERQVCILPENRGGSGGFAFGMTEALKTDCDWVFVADDDAVPRRDVFEQLTGFCAAHPDLAAQAAAVCTAVFSRDHHSSFHRSVLKKTPVGCLELSVPEAQYARPYFELDIYSFVGTMMLTAALRQAGVARADFFIYNDDYEHSLRLRRYGKIYCVPSAVMDHEDNLTRRREASWRDYYGTRNAVMFHKIHFGSYAAFWRAVRRLVMELPSRNPEKLRLIWQGIVDGFHLKSGLHPIYRPGWEPKRIVH